MKLRQVVIKNFRCLVDVSIPIDDSTILIGENNSGKTTFLDTLKIALGTIRSSNVKSSPFNEYDYYMSATEDSPQKSDGIEIELWFREDKTADWPEPLCQALDEIIQTDPEKDIDSIGLRLKSKYNSESKEFKFDLNFLDLNGLALSGRGANPKNYNNFLNYIRFFYLSSLRDCDTEFSPRSQFWGRILKDLKVSDDKKIEISESLKKINESLLSEDPRLESVISTLDNTQKIMELDEGQKTSIQALPLKPWDLMAKSEVFIKPRGGDVDFPLARHGQGTQSLAVLFIFQAYIDVLLKPSFRPETEAILALEELEAHLHPQAARSLAVNLSKIQSQKILTSHSPYFIQEIPFKQIRLFRRNGCSSKVLFIRQSFSAQLPSNNEIVKYCEKSEVIRFEENHFDSNNCTLTVKGILEKDEYRKLLRFYANNSEAVNKIKDLKEQSKLFLSDDELKDLDTYAKRVRGEVLFARGWLLCEGQSEYLLMRFFSNLLDKPFDKSGITVIDFQNNGSPGAFVGLANAFEIPWAMMCDNDEAGKDFVRQIKKRGLSDKEIRDYIRLLPTAGFDLEMFLINSGFLQDYVQIIANKNKSLSHKEGEPEFIEEVANILRQDKTGYTIALIEKLQNSGCDSSKVPEFFKNIINDITERVGKRE